MSQGCLFALSVITEGREIAARVSSKRRRQRKREDGASKYLNVTTLAEVLGRRYEKRVLFRSTRDLDRLGRLSSRGRRRGALDFLGGHVVVDGE